MIGGGRASRTRPVTRTGRGETATMALSDPSGVAAGRRAGRSAVGSAGLQRLTDLAATLLRVPSAGVALTAQVQTIAGASGRPAWRGGEQRPLGGTRAGAGVAGRGPPAAGAVRPPPRGAGPAPPR